MGLARSTCPRQPTHVWIHLQGMNSSDTQMRSYSTTTSNHGTDNNNDSRVNGLLVTYSSRIVHSGIGLNLTNIVLRNILETSDEWYGHHVFLAWTHSGIYVLADIMKVFKTRGDMKPTNARVIGEPWRTKWLQ